MVNGDQPWLCSLTHPMGSLHFSSPLGPERIHHSVSLGLASSNFVGYTGTSQDPNHHSYMQ